MKLKQVVVIGSGDTGSFIEEALGIGRYVAKNKWVLITGGRGGIMEAVSKGAFEENGTVIGVIPGDSFDGANPYCTIVIPSGIGFARNLVNVLSGDVVIAIGGKYGTLSELAYARQYGKPIICCGFADGWAEIFFENARNDDPVYPLYRARSVEEVYTLLDMLLRN